MKNENQLPLKYRKDYQPPSYLIDTVDLYIELGEEETHVTARMAVRANAEAKPTKNLVLDGENQKLLAVKINDKMLKSSDYQLTDKSLTLLHVPETFNLEIKTAIKPQENTELSGLYKSNDLFCTQCESEGFRRITYFLDRPDVLSKYVVTIVADKEKYPILLSNGNLIESGSIGDGLHWIKWEDPFVKPSYLFAMVAGNLEFVEDYFITSSDRKVTLRIFCESGYGDKCHYAMEALKKSMKWDEENYGREYDLDLFMIVAVHDFNFGAMENKGLNIFNAKYIFVNPAIATDTDYANVDHVVSHEYFHNWSGDRVTCRDWFQLCLKEGFTSFRDQSFSEDIGSKAVTRIKEVEALRNLQFPEDAGPLAHPIQPDAYAEIRNFYTMTVYEKGAEVIRMLQILLGKERFRKGTDLYFQRHDGCAVTCEDFIKAMEDVNDIDLSQFRLWYHQAGTPTLYLASKYDSEKQEWYLVISQHCPATPGQEEKKPMVLPLAMGLLNADGADMPLQLEGENKAEEGTKILTLTEEDQTFTFVNVPEKPSPSFLRHFSAPVKVKYEYRDEELAFLMMHDSDAFMRWEAGQIYALRIMTRLIHQIRDNKPLVLDEAYIQAFRAVLLDDSVDEALIARMLTLPTERYIADNMQLVDVDAIDQAYAFIKKELSRQLHDDFLSVYQMNFLNKPYEHTIESAAKRSLKNICLFYLAMRENPENYARCVEQFESADNMTDQQAALMALNDHDCSERKGLLQAFYEHWQNEPLMVDKWLTIQAQSTLPNTLHYVKDLINHPAFNFKNPNCIRALLYSFAQNNFVRFNDKSGEGYRFIADQVIKINDFNSQVAARLAKTLTQWKQLDVERQHLIKEQLQRILAHPKLSSDVREIVIKSL